MYECELAGLGEGVFFLALLPSHSLQLAELCANHVRCCPKAWLVAFSHSALIGYKLKMPLTERLLVCAVFSYCKQTERGNFSAQLSSPVPLSALTPVSLFIYGT